MNANNYTKGIEEERPTWVLNLMIMQMVSLFSCVVAGALLPISSKLQGVEEDETLMEDTTKNASQIVTDPTAKELPKASKEDLKRPPIAYPTILLLIFAYGLIFGGFYAYYNELLPTFVCTFINFYATYLSFTVHHDAVHMAVSPKYKLINEIVGTLGGIPLMSPLKFFRFMHLNHHRHSGDNDLDPDAWAGRGPTIVLPFRWATLFFYYTFHYARMMKIRLMSGISKETKQKDLILSATIFVMISLYFFGGLVAYHLLPPAKVPIIFYCVLLPQHLATTFLMYLFDYVPHRPHMIPYKQDPFRSTNVTSLLGSVDGVLWTSATLSQNLHTVHHLWPFMPFYTYKSLWKLHGEELVKKGTRIAPLFILGSRAEYFDELLVEEKKQSKGKVE